MKEGFKFGFKYNFELRIPGAAVQKWESVNLVPAGGIDYLMGILFGDELPPDKWCIGLLNADYGAASPTDTMSSVVPFEVNTLYDGAPDRFVWTPVVQSGVISNSTTVNFVFNQNATVGSVFLTSGELRGSTQGVLISVAPILPTALALTEGSELRVTATLTAQST